MSPNPPTPAVETALSPEQYVRKWANSRLHEEMLADLNAIILAAEAAAFERGQREGINACSVIALNYQLAHTASIQRCAAAGEILAAIRQAQRATREQP